MVGFDVTDVTVEGVTAARMRSCVSGCDLVITMLPNGSILQKVADEIQQSRKCGVFSCSTVGGYSKSVAAQMAATDIDMLDASIGGHSGGCRHPDLYGWRHEQAFARTTVYRYG